MSLPRNSWAVTLGAGGWSDMLVTHTPIHPVQFLFHQWNKSTGGFQRQEPFTEGVGKNQMLWCCHTLLWGTCLEDSKGETGRAMYGVCKGLGRGCVRVEESLKGKGVIWPKICVLTVTGGQGHGQENWFRDWAGLSYLCSSAAGIKLRAVTEKMMPIGMTSLRLYLIRCLYVILLQWNPFPRSNIFIFLYCQAAG